MSSHIPELILIGLVTILVGGIYLLDLCWHRPLRERKALKNVQLEIQRLQQEEKAGVPPSPSDYHYALSFDSNGFTVGDLRGRDHKTVVTRWADIHRATAFKRDLFEVDCISVSFRLANGTEIQVNEDMAGWRPFLNALPRQLSGCKPSSEWYATVAYPPFATNPTEVYTHAADQDPRKIHG